MGCGPSVNCETYVTPDPLLLEVCCSSYCDLRLQPGLYPQGTPLMTDPEDPLAMIAWDGKDKDTICGVTHCDEDLCHLDCPCPTSAIGAHACLNLKAMNWPEDMDPAIVAQLVAKGTKEGIKFKKPAGDCGGPADAPAELTKTNFAAPTV